MSKSEQQNQSPTSNSPSPERETPTLTIRDSLLNVKEPFDAGPLSPTSPNLNVVGSFPRNKSRFLFRRGRNPVIMSPIHSPRASFRTKSRSKSRKRSKSRDNLNNYYKISSSTPNSSAIGGTKDMVASSVSSFIPLSPKRGRSERNSVASNGGGQSSNPLYRYASRLDMTSLVRMIPPKSASWVNVRFYDDSTSIRAIWSNETWQSKWVELRADCLLFNDSNSPSSPSSFSNQGDVMLLFGLVAISKFQAHADDYVISPHRTTDREAKEEYDICLYRFSKDINPGTLGATLPCITLRFRTQIELEEWYPLLREQTFQRRPTIKDFHVICPIGRGASGSVFLVQDNVSKTFLALKAIEKVKIYQARSAFRHLMTEKITHQLCSEHPFIAQMRYAFQSNTHFYLVTDFYQGADLYYYMQRQGGYLTEHQAKRVVAEVIIALEELHSLGIIYRDLKPENVFLDENFHVRLADFGLSKLLDDRRDARTKTTCGTLAYVSPEMIKGDGYGASVDFWTLGIFTYNILFGHPPYEHEDLEDVMDTLTSYHIRYSRISTEAQSFIDSLLDLDVNTRLGCGGSGFDDLKFHPFLEDIDWFSIIAKDPHPHNLNNFVREPEGLEYGSEEQLLRNFEIENEDFLDAVLDQNEETVYLKENYCGLTVDGKRNLFEAGQLVGYFFNSSPDDIDPELEHVRATMSQLFVTPFGRSKSKLGKTLSNLGPASSRSKSKFLSRLVGKERKPQTATVADNSKRS